MNNEQEILLMLEEIRNKVDSVYQNELNEIQTRILNLFGKLTLMERGEIIGRMETMIENREKRCVYNDQ